MKKATVTLPTSTKHAILLQTARARAPNYQCDFLDRIGRSLDEFGSLTPAMIESCITIISPSS